MRPCDLCQSAILARVAFLGERSDRRAWLCQACFSRFEEHDLEPEELLSLARLTAQRQGRCEWCAESEPAAQVRVPGADGRIFAFQLCAPCAKRAKEESGGRILHGEAAVDGQVTVDPRYERALAVHRRRRALRRIK